MTEPGDNEEFESVFKDILEEVNNEPLSPAIGAIES